MKPINQFMYCFTVMNGFQADSVTKI